MQTSVPKHTPWLCQPATFRPQCTQTQSPWLCLPCRIQTMVYPNTVHGFANLQHSDQCTQTHSTQTHSPQLCLPGNIQTTVYPNTQSMALSTCNIQTTVYPNTVHGFVIQQQLDHRHKAQPETFRPQCTQTHSPWLCQPATFRPVYPNTQSMALSACNTQTSVPKHTVHGFVSLQHSDHSVTKQFFSWLSCITQCNFNVHICMHTCVYACGRVCVRKKETERKRE